MNVILLKVLYGFMNCYILADENARKCAVIDPGGNPKTIHARVNEHGYEPAAILLTHGHFDHSGGVRVLREEWKGIPVYLSDRDKVLTDDRRIARLYPDISATTPVSEGLVIPIGDMDVTVMETPGHTQGSVTYIAQNALFCGDTLFHDTAGRTDLYGGDAEQLMLSLRRIYNLPGNYTVYPGHMQPTELQTERETNPYFKSFS